MKGDHYMEFVMRLFKETDELLKELYEKHDIYIMWQIMRNWGWIKEVLVSEFYSDHMDYDTYKILTTKADRYYKDVRDYIYVLKSYSE